MDDGVVVVNPNKKGKSKFNLRKDEKHELYSDSIVITKDKKPVEDKPVKKEEPKKEAAAEVVVPEEDKWIVDLIAERKAAKKAKDFARADAIREELLAKGITLVDTREGTKYTKN